MRAIEAKTFSGYGGLRQTDLPRPQPAPDRVLVRVTAAGVTPLDHTILSGGHPRAKAPLVLGNEAAGIIEDAGDSGLAMGSRVMFTGPYGVTENGAWQEWLLVRPELLALVPDAIDDVVAASLPVAYLTAELTLTLAGFKPGMTVLAPGIGGSVGNATCQFVRAEGTGKVISTAGGAAKSARARELGFEDVVDLSAEGLAEGVRRITAGKGVDCHREHRRPADERGAEQPCSRRCPDHVGLFGRAQIHDRSDGPHLEARADGRLLSVRPVTGRDCHRVAGRSPADPRRIRQAGRRADPSLRRGGRSLAPSDRGSTFRQSRPGGMIRGLAQPEAKVKDRGSRDRNESGARVDCLPAVWGDFHAVLSKG